jgi:hypothetical protein
MRDDFRSLSLIYPLNIDHASRAIVLSNYSERIRFEGVSPEVALDVLERLNNNEEIPNSDESSEFIHVLKRENLAVSCTRPYCTGEQMADLLQAQYTDWNQKLFSGLLWTSLFNGTAEKHVVDGWLIESYHFIRGASARLSYAAANAADERIRQIFTHHSVEEYDHYKFFAESLRRRGFDPLIVDQVGPLPTTRAVIDMARYAARTDCLAYAACSGLLESTGSDAGKARSFYSAVSGNFDKEATDFVAPMLQHIDLDEAYEHGSVMRDVLAGVPLILADRADSIVQLAHLFKEILEFWFEDIVRTYHLKPVDRRALRRDYRSNVRR